MVASGYCKSCKISFQRSIFFPRVHRWLLMCFVCVWAPAPFFCCFALVAGFGFAWVDTHFWPGEVHFDSTPSDPCFLTRHLALYRFWHFASLFILMFSIKDRASNRPAVRNPRSPTTATKGSHALGVLPVCRLQSAHWKPKTWAKKTHSNLWGSHNYLINCQLLLLRRLSDVLCLVIIS